MLRAFLLLFAIGSIASAAEKSAAIVNGEAITAAELDAVLKQIPPSTSPVSETQRKQQRFDTLQAMIDDKLIRQFLKQHGAKIEASEVEKQFAALEAAQKAVGKSVEDYLKETGLTTAQIKENLLRMLQLARYIDLHMTIDKLKPYFEANHDFFDRVTVRTSHIVLRVSATATSGERQKAQETLRSIRAELAAGKIEFAAAAKAHSQCPSAAKGGDIGLIVRKFQADEAYARTAFALKVGEVSDIVETEVGYHLIWVTDRKPGKPTRYEDAAQDVRECYEAELKQALLTELRSKAKIEIRAN